MEEKKISVVMSVYNVEKYIKEAIDSVLNSTHKNIELIIVNDCTTDASMSIVDQYNDGRIRVINHKENLGAGMARRTGIENATGDYIITIDADDWISEDFLESLLKRALETDADMTGAGITYVYEGKENKETHYEETISTGLQKYKDYNGGKIIFLNNKLVKREMYDKVQYNGRRFCEDTPTIIPLMYYANKIAYVDNVGYYYRMRDTSITHTLNPLKDNLYKALCAVDCIEFFKDKEFEYRNIIPLSQLFGHISKLKDLKLTKKDIEPYAKDFAELMVYILNILNFQ